MRSETIAIHGGYDVDPTTKAVAVPIYQTVAYAFDSAEHGAALFNLEVEGFRYTRISNPTNAVLERRVAALEGGVEALCVSSGQAALNYAVAQRHRAGQQHRLGAAALRHDAHAVRACAAEPGRHRALRRSRTSPTAIEQLIDDKTKAVFCESVGNPAGNICDIEALAERRAPARRAADRRQHGGDADPAPADRLRRRHRRAFADQVHGRPRHHARRHHRRQRTLPLEAARRALSDVQRAGRVLSRPGLHRSFRRRAPTSRAAAASTSAPPARCCRRSAPSCCCRASRRWRCGSSATSRMPGKVAEFLRDDPRVGMGQLCGLPRQSLSRAGAEISRRPRLLAADLRRARRLRGRQAVLRRARAGQAAGQHGRRQVARLPSGLDHAPADVAGGAAQGRRAARR